MVPVCVPGNLPGRREQHQDGNLRRVLRHGRIADQGGAERLPPAASGSHRRSSRDCRSGAGSSDRGGAAVQVLQNLPARRRTVPLHRRFAREGEGDPGDDGRAAAGEAGAGFRLHPGVPQKGVLPPAGSAQNAPEVPGPGDRRASSVC